MILAPHEETGAECWRCMFRFLVLSVMADGGDGDGHIYTKHHSKELVAEQFEKFLAEEFPHIKRQPDNGNFPHTIWFWDGHEENYTISADLTEELPCWVTTVIYI